MDNNIITPIQRLPEFLCTGNNVEHARRESSLGADFRKQESRQPGNGGGLQHHGVAHGQSRSDLEEAKAMIANIFANVFDSLFFQNYLPSKQHEGKVPGHDSTDDTDGLPLAHLILAELSPAGVVVQVSEQAPK